ncbi:hypothetical protein GCM10023084_32130 [Streptomyces lacrimifluminis]|uniref:Uncharacterized protein n=1 Tax=Streptomyces lacrimifluminis TaxID=1500077 RepID=A0A917KUL3_9ACTN|nr:hypothetical protein GCM10012282_28750 [Streptomyces lacrimifluminis]
MQSDLRLENVGGVQGGQPVLVSLGYAAAAVLPVAAWLVRICVGTEPPPAPPWPRLSAPDGHISPVSWWRCPPRRCSGRQRPAW